MVHFKLKNDGSVRKNFIANAIVNIVMFTIVSVYFIVVVGRAKVRSNWQLKWKTFFIATAFMMRDSLSFYDCFLNIDKILTQYWRYGVNYYIGVAFMCIYIATIFRVFGCWTLLKEI